MNESTYVVKEKSYWHVKRYNFIYELKKNWFLYALLVPFVVWFLLFSYRPLIGLQAAFKDYDILLGLQDSEWVGLAHFKEFFGSEYFLRTLKNTLIINIYALVFGFPAPIILALLLNEIKNANYKKIIQTMTYLPHFISIVVIVQIVTSFLSPSTGLLNLLIEKFGGERIYFLIKPEYFRTIYTTMNIWKEIGFGAVVYIAALSGIDPQLYEAAEIDGAGKMKQMWHITIKSILPTIMIMLILKVGMLLNVGFETIILMYQPATYETADVISSYVYRLGIQQGRYDIATAVGLANSLVAVLLVYTTNKISKKYTETGIW